MATVMASDDSDNVKIKMKGKKKKKTQKLLKKKKKKTPIKEKKTPVPPSTPDLEPESDKLLPGGGYEGPNEWSGAFSCANNGNMWMFVNVLCCPCASIGSIWEEYHQPGGFFVGCCCQCPCCWHMLREKIAVVDDIEDNKFMAVACPCLCPCLNCSQLIMTAHKNGNFDGFALHHGANDPGSPKMSRVPQKPPEKGKNGEKGAQAEGAEAADKGKKGKPDLKTDAKGEDKVDDMFGGIDALDAE